MIVVTEIMTARTQIMIVDMVFLLIMDGPFLENNYSLFRMSICC